MANTKSAEKRNRQAQKRRARNINVRTTVKDAVKNLRDTLTTKDTAKFVKVLNQKVVNADFGTHFLDVKRPYRLFLPSALKLSPPSPTPIASPNSDHFMCYKVSKTAKTAKFVPVSNVTVKDQFENITVTVLRPVLLCVPVDVNGGQLMQ